jgi:hypothetical protein
MRYLDAFVAALVGGPVRSVLADAVILYALGTWLGWWAVGAIAIGAVLDMARWPRGWRRPA